MANNDLGTAFTHVAFPPDRKARSLLWHLYVLPAHLLRLIAFLDLDARVVSPARRFLPASRNSFDQL
jgi:hypothetical protein